jgi:hypothetical protein
MCASTSPTTSVPVADRRAAAVEHAGDLNGIVIRHEPLDVLMLDGHLALSGAMAGSARRSRIRAAVIPLQAKWLSPARARRTGDASATYHAD